MLSADQRSALWLHYVEGYTTAQVAAVLERAEASARVLLFRARQRLGRELEQREQSAPPRAAGRS